MRKLLRMYVNWAGVWRLRETRSKWGGNQVTESLECLDAKVEPNLAGSGKPFPSFKWDYNLIEGVTYL